MRLEGTKCRVLANCGVSPPGAWFPHRRGAGFTLLELIMAMAIVGILASIAIPSVREMIEKARVAKAIGDIRAIQTDIEGVEPLPTTLAEVGRGGYLDPWGNPYQYLKFDPKGGKGQARKDRFLVPLNSTFDLYSMGRDGATALPLTAKAARDDIVRANDGGFIGLASNF